ncbi:hypothetical protein ACSBR1_034319 [Camellia fascicularis]
MSGTVGMTTTLVLSSSPLKKLEEEAALPMAIEKQGIVSILGSDTKQLHQQTKGSSLRRTLSADMSSKKWLAQNGFSPMKKIASSQAIAVSVAVADSSSSEEGEEEFESPGQDEVWRSIQSKSQKKEEIEKPSQVDIWSSILSHKANEDKTELPPPYVHPLVKRSASTLSEKSLEVCTESLGSETGSDVFSSYPSSEKGDVEEDKEEEEAQQPQEEKELQYSFDIEELLVEKYNYSTSKKLGLSSFPPPLPSLAHRDGPSLHMQSHRENGRLVLEAVSTPLKNNFRAHRQGGRLILEFASQEPNPYEIIGQHRDDDEVEEIERVFDNFKEEIDNEDEENEIIEAEDEGEEDDDDDDDDDDDEEDEEEVVVEKIENKIGTKEIGIVKEQAPKLSSGAINVHRSAIMMKKLLGLDYRSNSTWTTKKFNEAVNLVEMEEEEEGCPPPLTTLAQSLPRPTRVARLIPSSSPTTTTATSFNAYEYFWRTKPTVANLINNPIIQQCPPLKNNYNKVFLSSGKPTEQEMVILRRNREDYLVPLLRGCKESRRSLLIWEPCTIASS